MRFRWAGKLSLVVTLVVATAVACGSPSGPRIRAEDVWSRPAIALDDSPESSAGGSEMGKAMGGTGAIYMVLSNEGREADRLIGARTDVARVAEIHETRMEGDVMKMQMLPDGLDVPAMGQVRLEPGGYHVMLVGLRRDLEAGDRFVVELQFEKSGSLIVQPEVREP